MLLDKSASNRRAFLKLPWQSWLLGLLASFYRVNPLYRYTHQAGDDVHRLVVDLFTLLFYHCIQDEVGWATLADGEARCLQHYFLPAPLARESWSRFKSLYR